MSIKPINLSATSNTKINGCIKVPGDKSISHRAIIISSIAYGRTIIKGYLNSTDIDATINACRAIGADIKEDKDSLIIDGNDLERGYGENVDLSFGNSGTSMRLMMGILSAQKFPSVLRGDESLTQRPMNRVTNPLLRMNADIKTSDGTPPIYINPVSFLKCVDHTIEIASAQIKSSIMLAGLYGDSVFKIITPQSRDHTEIMLNEFGCNISIDRDYIKMEPGKLITPNHIEVPGDISSAAFYIVGSIISKDSQIKIENVGLNPLRTGFIKILEMMGANIQILNKRTINGELIGDIYTESSTLNGIEIPKELIASSIDELPLIVLAASQANGKTSIRNAEELRVKESDRISSMINMMDGFKISTDEYSDGMNVYGGSIQASRVNSFGDHRIAMTALMASLVSDGDILVEYCKNIDTSFPTFIETANNIGMDIKKND